MRGVLEAARAQRAALLPPHAACEVCAESDPLRLDANAAVILCADHAAAATGRPAVEHHHLAGRRWAIVLDLTPAWHRIVTVLQQCRDEDTSFAQALLRGIADLLYAIADHLQQRQRTAAVRAKRPRGRTKPA